MFRPMFGRQAATTGAVVLSVGGMALYPKTVYAESPLDSPSVQSRRKPIYDNDDDSSLSSRVAKTVPQANSSPTAEEKSAPPASSSSSQSPSSLTQQARSAANSSTTPTDQVANQVRHARLFVYNHSLAAENAFNDALSRVFHIESRFTSTIASLAPPVESGERLVPGSIYVLVAAMAGSIVSRNRGILLRTSTPVALGTVAAYSLLPITMRNVGDLVWEYEKRVPALAEQHVRVRSLTEESWNKAVAHSEFSRNWMEDKIGEGRRSLDEWIKKDT